MLIIKLLAVAALLGSIAWAVAAPDYEPVIATITSLSALIAIFVADKRREASTHQRQLVSGSGVGIQAGGDISVGNIGNSQERGSDAK
jgi:ABC-type taurine transport system substrate-binding protein